MEEKQEKYYLVKNYIELSNNLNVTDKWNDFENLFQLPFTLLTHDELIELSGYYDGYLEEGNNVITHGINNYGSKKGKVYEITRDEYLEYRIVLDQFEEIQKYGDLNPQKHQEDLLKLIDFDARVPVDVMGEFEWTCRKEGIPFTRHYDITPYDDSTLFCIAGMQQYKDKFKNPDNTTCANVQSCMRFDIDEIGDGTHLLCFDMLGLFSFNDWSLEQAIEFWVVFVKGALEIDITYVTVHPDKFDEWSKYYEKYGIEVRTDNECKWSDGDIEGYCTEFYHNDIEIGNIVNPLGDCIDSGFGLRRLSDIANGSSGNTDKVEILKEAIDKVIKSGYKPSQKKQGYVLKRLIRELNKIGGKFDHPYFNYEVKRQQKVQSRYNQLKDRFKDMPKEWWWETHGVDIENID